MLFYRLPTSTYGPDVRRRGVSSSFVDSNNRRGKTSGSSAANELEGQPTEAQNICQKLSENISGRHHGQYFNCTSNFCSHLTDDTSWLLRKLRFPDLRSFDLSPCARASTSSHARARVQRAVAGEPASCRAVRPRASADGIRRGRGCAPARSRNSAARGSGAHSDC